VIINGELQTGLGGGTCQVSTTVYNAAYEAGLPIVERTNHSLYISHYPQGRDATVNYPDVDLKFQNDTGHWILLRTFESTYSLTVRLYGTSPHRRVESETGALVTTGPVPVKRVADPTMLVGKEVTEETGSPPRSTSDTRRVYNSDGKLLREGTFYSSYLGEPTVIRYGTKPKPKPKPKPAATADSPLDGAVTADGALPTDAAAADGTTTPAATTPNAASTTPTTSTTTTAVTPQ
jgi:hypothetical protein